MPSVVLGNLNVDIATLRKLVGVDVANACEERIELGRDIFEAEVDGRGALVDDGINLTTGHLGSQSIALDVYVDHSIIILTSLGLGDLNAGASALADLLNLGTLTTDDVGADGCGDGDIDGLL